MTQQASPIRAKPHGTRRAIIKKDLRVNRAYYIMALPMIIYYVVFHYIPMYGVMIAFIDYNLVKGVFNSPWVGFKHFVDFVNSYYAFRIIRNTFLLSLFSMLFSFPMPIILALLLNEVKTSWYKRTVQTVTYMPHFISMVVMCGIIKTFSATGGVFNQLASLFTGRMGGNLLQNPRMFRSIYIISDIWQGVGWGSIIYLSAISGIDQEQYESATIDGANLFQKMFFITIPNIMSTVIILLILRMGQLMNVGFEKVFLLYNEATWSVSDVISTYVYRMGLVNHDYSYSSAVGLFNAVINICFLLSANWLSRKFSETSLI